MVAVLVVGGGPAGWAVADQCAALGLDTLLVTPRPDRVWPATYGLWADQCGALPTGARVVRSVAWAGERRLDRGYAVLDNDSVLRAFRRGPVRVTAGVVRAVEVDAGVATATLGSGETVRAGVVVDASGARRVLSGGVPRGVRVEQSAFGVVVPAEVAAPVVAPGEAVFMRWGREHRDWASFLYAVPVPGGRTLLEETSLARRPGVRVADLRDRLVRRLERAGVPAGEVVGDERVRFAVDTPLPRRRPGVVAFGVAGGMMHPASGYSVGDALVTAPAVAAAIAEALPAGADAAARAAHEAVWPAAARVVRGLRFAGLRTLLALPAAEVPGFFDTFFALPERSQRAYLSGRDDLRGTAAAMTALFRAAPWRLRAVMATGWAAPRAAGGSTVRA